MDARRVIFDLDGTLADTMPALADLAVGLITEGYGLDRKTAREMYMSCIGLSFHEQLDELFPHQQFRNVATAAHFAQRRRAIYESASLFRTATTAVKMLHASGIDVDVCSSSPRWFVEKLCAGLQEPLTITGIDDGTKIEQLRLASRRGATFVGDAPRDALLARSASISLSFIGVRHTVGYYEFERIGARSVPSLIDVALELS